jgi:uncharacterized protein
VKENKVMMYRRYGQYLRETFGTKVFKVSVDAGFTCPVLDGSKAEGGCAYCNNKSFRPGSVDRRQELRTQIESGIAHQRVKYGANKFIVYFQNFTNTYGEVEELRGLYETALEFDDVVGLSIGTRPDCVPTPVLELLAEFAERTSLWVEYGLESSHDSTLLAIQRGHDYNCFVDAVQRTEKYPKIHMATHVIFGLPGESEDMMLQTIDRVSSMPIEGIKLHHLHVVKGTILARQYAEKPFPVFDLPGYTSLLGKALQRLRKDIVVFRIFGMCPEDILIAPHWNLRKQEIQNRILATFRQEGVEQGTKFQTPSDSVLSV